MKHVLKNITIFTLCVGLMITALSCTGKKEDKQLECESFDMMQETDPKAFGIVLVKGELEIGEPVDLSEYKLISRKDNSYILSNIANTYSLEVIKCSKGYYIYSITPTSQNITTPMGAHLGMSTKSLKKLYNLSAVGNSLVYSGNNCCIKFDIEQDYIKSMTVKVGTL